MTPAVKSVKALGISYTLHEYPYDSTAPSYGEEAATLLGVDPHKVFKTLIVSINTNQLAVAIVPVSHQLNLKAIAKILGAKKATMADPQEAEKATGYVLGGISPLGLKKRLPCIVDISAQDFNTIFVSGGRRGLEIELASADLILLCTAEVGFIKSL